MDIRSMFLGANLAKEFAGYLGLVDTLNGKIDRLSGSEFEAAIRSLEQAARSVSERDSLLREARSKFNKAISLEDDERLALSYMGLAFCHMQLGDVCNVQAALREVNNIEISGEATSIAKSVTAGILFGLLASVFISGNFNERKEKLKELKSSVQSFLETAY